MIANVLEARNYLYLWIYAHHKVTYYANFLLPVLSRCVLTTISNELNTLKEQIDDIYQNPLSVWTLDYTNIHYLDDNYFWAIIKVFYYKNLEEGGEWERLCRELLSRKYKISLYKSLAEYDLLFESFTDMQKQEIQGYICRHIRNDFPSLLDEGEYLAGYPDSSMLTGLRSFGASDNITNIVYVSTSYKAKKFFRPVT